MFIVHSDSVFRVEPGATPDYKSGNSLVAVLGLMEAADLAAGREHYVSESLDWLFPFGFLELYGPAAPSTEVLDPAMQDDKQDFQKQNVRRFITTDVQLARGFAGAGDWTGAFLRLSYRGGPDSLLSRVSGHRLGPAIRMWIRVGNSAPALVRVPYNPATDRYDIELWAYPGGDLRARLDEKGQAAFDRGAIVQRLDLVRGDASAFDRDGKDGVEMTDVDPGHAMHPILPLRVELAWSDESGTFWDSRSGANYTYEFSMLLRGWDHYLAAGTSPNPHGGIGFLEYRNLVSNYFGHARLGELGRRVEPWSFDASGRKRAEGSAESFFAVDYMDLHVLRPTCGIGLHRHRDNQEVFFMLAGRAYMVIGDWCQFPGRERAFEIRTLRPGHFAFLRGGQLHGLMNATDEDVSLFMFGGYD